MQAQQTQDMLFNPMIPGRWGGGGGGGGGFWKYDFQTQYTE